MAGAESATPVGISPSRVGREAALGRRGSVELTKSEEDLFKEGELLIATFAFLNDDLSHLHFCSKR